MNPFLTFIAVASLVIVNIECQPLNDARFGFIPYLAEQFSPVLRHHRARLRPFTTQFGSPIINVRAGRSIKEQPNQTQTSPDQKPRVECVYAFESLFCAGINKDGNEVKVECDARENLRNTGLGDVTRFAISDLRDLKTGEEQPITKMYMFGQKENSTEWMSYIVKDEMKNRNIISVHSRADGLADQGLTILDAKCWDDMLKFFRSMLVVNQIQVESQIKTPHDLKTVTEPVRIIAHLNIL